MGSTAENRPVASRAPSTRQTAAPLYQGSALNPTPTFDRNDLLLLAALTLIALLLRIPGLNDGLWYDEIWTLLDFVRLPAAEIVTSVSELNNHVLYSLSAHFTSLLLGESAVSLRLPAMVFGVLTVPAMYFLGLQLADRRQALLATAFLVFNYHHVWFSQNARGYSGVALGMVIASILFIRLLTTASPGKRLVVGYAVVVALTAWLNLTGALIILIHGMIWLGLARAHLLGRQARVALPCGAALALSVLLILLLYAPILDPILQSFAIGNAVAEAHYEWDSGLWTMGEFLHGVTLALPGGWVAVMVVIVVMLAGITALLRRGLTIAGLLLLPLLVPVTVSMVVQNIFFPRYVVCALPFILLVGVAGGFKLASVFTPFLSKTQVLLAGLAVALLTGSQVPHAWSPKQDFAKAAAFIETRQHAQTAFVCIDLTYLPMVDYLQADCLGASSLDELQQIEAAHQEVYLFYTLPIRVKYVLPGVIGHVQDNYSLDSVLPGTLGGGDITIMTKAQTSSQPGTRP